MTTRTPPARTTPTAVDLLGATLHEEVVECFTARTDHPRTYVEDQVRECLRYLYLVSRHPDRLAGLFLPVEQEIDEIWHFLILQTREYRRLCEEQLPGGHFIHHRSIAYTDYQDGERRQDSRRTAAEEALRWIPLYTAAFGPFDERALPHWTVVRFLHEQMDMDLAEISALGAEETAEPSSGNSP
ncbi:hypothetical protein ABT160_05625 [Streptomyces sp. NPDC001941]|uniref:hypothetical protein n=1 Tax=Streptomyces sp. NPDC001941 TaxID=3154659 RepID=UPI00332460CE